MLKHIDVLYHDWANDSKLLAVILITFALAALGFVLFIAWSLYDSFLRPRAWTGTVADKQFIPAHNETRLSTGTGVGTNGQVVTVSVPITVSVPDSWEVTIHDPNNPKHAATTMQVDQSYYNEVYAGSAADFSDMKPGLVAKGFALAGIALICAGLYWCGAKVVDHKPGWDYEPDSTQVQVVRGDSRDYNMTRFYAITVDANAREHAAEESSYTPDQLALMQAQIEAAPGTRRYIVSK